MRVGTTVGVSIFAASQLSRSRAPRVSLSTSSRRGQRERALRWPYHFIDYSGAELHAAREWIGGRGCRVVNRGRRPRHVPNHSVAALR